MRDAIGNNMRISACTVSVRFVPEGEGSRTRRDPVIASPSQCRLIGRSRDFVGSLGWHDLKQDLRDFTIAPPFRQEYWITVIFNYEQWHVHPSPPPGKTWLECTCSFLAKY